MTLALCQEAAPNGSIGSITGNGVREPGARNPTVRGEAATAGTPGSSSLVTPNGPSGTLKLRILQAYGRASPESFAPRISARCHVHALLESLSWIEADPDSNRGPLHYE